MKIQSKFNDYYDSVAYMYGGGDPKIYYERDVYKTFDVEIPRPANLPFDYLYCLSNFEFKNLVIGDYWFTLYRKLLPGEMTPNEFQVLLDPKELLKGAFKWNKNGIKAFVKNAQFNKCNKTLQKVSRAVQNPVYLILSTHKNRDSNRIVIQDHYVPLHKYGIPKIYPPEQIYQDLSYFISNIIHESPDVKPVGKPPQTDKEKLVAHGMDLRYSFRHRS